MFGLSYHCGNCDGLASRLNLGKCPTCGSSSVVPAGWYQLSVEERAGWLDRIQGRLTPVDRWGLSQPGIRPRVELPPLQLCTAAAARHAVMFPPRPLPRPSPLGQLWIRFCAWVSTVFAAPEPAAAALPAAPEPMVAELEMPPVVILKTPARVRARPIRPVVWSRQHAPREPVRVQRTRTTRGFSVVKSGPGPPRRRRLRFA